MPNTQIAVGVNVNLANGDSLSGWLYGKSPVGFYVALDSSAQVIRFIPNGTWQSIAYDYSNPVNIDPLIDFSDRINISVSPSLNNRAKHALDNVDYNRIRRINTIFANLQAQFYGPYDLMQFQPDRQNDEPSVLLDIALDLRSGYIELIDEVRRSGLGDILLEDEEEIRQIIKNQGLPEFDSWTFGTRKDREYFLIEYMSYLAERKNLLAETNLGEYTLQELSTDRIAQHINDDEYEDKPQQQKPSQLPKKLKKCAALGRIAVGGSLAAANICAGAFAGVIVALPTLGVGTVAGAVGVATSAYTGLNAACDGLKDLAAALEST